jgi:hypothetical protein
MLKEELMTYLHQSKHELTKIESLEFLIDLKRPLVCEEDIRQIEILAKSFSVQFDDRVGYQVKGMVQNIKNLRKLIKFVNSKQFCLKKMGINLKKRNNYFEKIISYFHIINMLEKSEKRLSVDNLELIYKIDKINCIFMSESKGTMLKRRDNFTKDKVKSCINL